MTEPYFDEDVPLSLSPSSAASSAASSGASIPLPDLQAPQADSPHSPQGGSVGSHRPRGSRGRGQRQSRTPSANGSAQVKWRSGQIPAAPVFEGDIDRDPYCLRHYRKRLLRWVRITKEFLPANEQALRAREQLKGEAELEFEEVDDSRFDHADGIQRLLQDLEESFGEKELFRQGGAIREFEAMGRLQGESITEFVRRFRLLERKLQDSRVPAYPEQARVIKLLDGLRLDERSTSALLLAAGNRYEMKPILDAIKLHYPAGMSVTGLPLRASSSTAAPRRHAHKGKSKRVWHADWSVAESVPEEDYAEDIDQVLENEEALPNEEDFEYDEDEYDETNEDVLEADQAASAMSPPQDAQVLEALQALTVTSKRLPDLTKARGFFKPDDKRGDRQFSGKGGGKQKGKGKSSKGRGFSKGKSKGKGKGSSSSSPSPMPNQANLDLQQKRIKDALCLGCGSPNHWLRDCPSVQRHSAQLVTAGLTLDASGNVDQPQSWMTFCSQPVVEKESIQLPELDINQEGLHQRSTSLASFGDYKFEYHSGILSNPKVLIQYANTDAALMIADTGCQRQVAGKKWHLQRQHEILPLKTIPYVENCHFSFGPNAGVPSKRRHAYPSGIAGRAIVLGVSEVDENAPALFSRPAFELLGAVPDVIQGVMHYKALDRESPLYLSQCGHLAIRVDEWPSDCFQWPQLPESDTLPDVWIPGQTPLKKKDLARSAEPARPPPHAGPSIFSTRMVEELEVHGRAPDRVQLHGRADGVDLLRSEHEACFERPHVEDLVAKVDGNNYVSDNYGSSSSNHDSKGEVQEPARDLHPRGQSSTLWGSRLFGDHLRSMRSSLVQDGRGRSQTNCSEGISRSKDTARASQEKVRKPGRFIHWLATGLTAALGTLAVSSGGFTEPPNYQSLEFEGSSSPDRSPSPPLGTSATSASTRTHEHCERQFQGQGSRRMATPWSSAERLRLRESPEHGVGISRGGRGSESWQLRVGSRERTLTRNSPAHDGRAERTMSPMPTLCGSADEPLVQEDRGVFTLRQGTQKRLLGDAKALNAGLQVEQKIYATQVRKAMNFRRQYKCDLVEVYAGFGNVTAEGLTRQLRVLQPVDKVHGINLETQKDHECLRELLKRRRPFLTLWEIRCDPWSRIQYLNYTKEELDALRVRHKVEMREMCKTICEMHADGSHFLLENPWGTDFWKQPELAPLFEIPQVSVQKGAMCNFGLRGKEGRLLKKETGWCSDLPELLKYVAVPCPGHHEHEECLGSNAKRGQVYTKKLAKAVVDGLCQALFDAGDERFCLPPEPHNLTAWIVGPCASVNGEPTWSSWSSTSGAPLKFATCWYLDIVRDEESWKPLLKEVEQRLHSKVQSSAFVKPDTAFFEQINHLVPWTICQIQIAKTPKSRRLPTNLLLKEEITHRAAILLFSNGQLQFETEEVSSILSAPGARFETPVSYAIFLYGRAPATTLEPEANKLPEAPRTAASPTTPAQGAPSTPAPEELQWHPSQPGAQDIHFPGLTSNAVPQWMLSVLKRLHINLGHPGKEALIRHLAAAGASGPALHGAKHLECRICERTKPPKQPRPTKAYQARRFGDRLQIDIIYVKDITGHSHMFLSQVDEATTYQVLDRLDTRSEEEITSALIKGWFRFFGFPDEMLLDAEGAMRGFQFELLCAQASIKVRFVPPDAHWQLGRGERHGQAAKWIMSRLVSQFAATSSDEMELLSAMACFSKNTLARRAGASPCQWVYGRNPKVPAALLSEPDSIEAKQVIDDNEKFRQIEEVRHAAMKEFLDYEYNEALRKAILRKNRPWRGPLEVGQKIAYYRQRNQLDGEGTNEGYRQGMIIGLDPGPTGSVWVRNNRGRLIQVAREQVRAVEGEELWSPSSDDLRMLKSAEVDLSQKHALAFQHAGPAPRLAEDRMILDAAGREVRGELPAPPILALPDRPVQEQPSTVGQQTSALVPIPELPGEQLELPQPPAKKARSQGSEPKNWFLDPDGRPTVVVDNATSYAPLPRDFQHDQYKFRTTWIYNQGMWQKIEDQVPWEKKPSAEPDLPQGSVEKLVTTYSPTLERGRMPSIDSIREVGRGMKRQADETPEKVDEPLPPTTTTPPVQNESDPTATASTALQASAYVTQYCINCGCKQWQECSVNKLKCARCMSSTYTLNPFEVESWFDEIEEKAAYERAAQEGDLVLDNKSIALQLPFQDEMDELHQNESYILDVGQVYATPPEDLTGKLWSVAKKSNEDDFWSWTHVFENIDIDQEAVQDSLSHAKVFLLHHHVPQPRKPEQRPKRISRTQWLRRHGRHCVYLIGWDGSPPELQPLFQHDRFEQVLHACSHAVATDLTTTTDPDLLQDAREQAKQGFPTWSQRARKPRTPSVFHTSFEADQVIAGPSVSSGEEGDVAEEGGGRAVKQALKREIPWRSIAKEDWAEFVKSMVEEWSEWEKWSSCKPIRAKKGEIDEKLILKSRVCYRWKPKDGGKWYKAKARIVVAGFADPHLPLLSRDAPVLAKTSLVLIIQWAATFGTSLWNGDCKSAFLQGEPDTERPTRIFMRPPQDDIAKEAVPEWKDSSLLYQLTAPVYGQANAPRRWFLHVLKVLTELGWEQHTLDPCCFLQRRDSQVVAVLGVHVDDIIVTCLPDHEEHLDLLRKAFAWGADWEKDSFIFVGRKIHRHEDGSYTIDQTHYVSEVSLTKIEYDLEDKLSDHPELITEFRSGIGSLQWLAGTSRGDLAADVSLLQKPPKDLTVGDLKEVNRVLKYVRATANSGFRIVPVKPENITFIAYGDSGWANAPGNKSQGGLVILITNKNVLFESCSASLVEWKSYRHQRVLRSTLAAEAASLDRAHDVGTFMACVLGEMIDVNYRAASGQAPFEVTPVTDARSLWDAIHRLSTTFSEKRVEIDVANLRATCRGLRWVPTELQHADGLTKRCAKLRDQFRQWAMRPVVTLVESRSAADGADNAAWRNCAKPKESKTSANV